MTIYIYMIRYRNNIFTTRNIQSDCSERESIAHNIMLYNVDIRYLPTNHCKLISGRLSEISFLKKLYYI